MTEPTSPTDSQLTESNTSTSKSADVGEHQTTLKSASSSTAPTHTSSRIKEHKRKAQPTKLSKVGLLALLLSSLSLAGGGYLFWWQQQQNASLVSSIKQHNTTQLANYQQQLAGQLQQQLNRAEQTLQTQWQQALQQQQQQSQQQMQQQLTIVQQDIAKLAKFKPRDWQLAELHYLLTMAARSLWLEKNAQVASSLLNAANQQIEHFNDPQLLPLQQAVTDDLTQLSLLPQVKTEQLMLSLNALTKQVALLPIEQVSLPASTDSNPNALALTNNIADWRHNLAKVWHKFLADFITIKHRTGDVTPLLAPNQQQNLRANLQLKLQLAQWAVSQQQEKLYQQTMTDISAWLTTYFDTKAVAVQQFSATITHLAAQPVSVVLPSSLHAIPVIRKLMEDNSTTQPAANHDKPVNEKSGRAL